MSSDISPENEELKPLDQVVRPKLKGMNLREQIPMQNIGRCIALQNLREITAEKINLIKDRKHRVFIMEMEDGSYEIDWEFAIFEATEYQYASLFNCFTSKPVQKIEEEKSLIITNDTLGAGTRPPLIIEE